MPETKTKQCAMCGAHVGKPHHDHLGKGRTVRKLTDYKGQAICFLCRIGRRMLDASRELALTRAQYAQTRYWERLKELETELGFEIDVRDLDTYTVEGLIAEFGPDQEAAHG